MSEIDNIAIKEDLQDYRIKVLLIDDQAFVGETVKRMLADQTDIDFHYCQDPSQALKTAVEVSPTVILQDLVMPDIDGMTLVRYYRAHSILRDVPVIVLSSKEEAETKAELFANGANDYLVKLPDKIELIARIRYHSRGYINLLERNDAYKALNESQKAMLKELEKAADYVRSLLPAPISSDTITTRWNFTPSEQLGGDAFGYHWIDDENFAFYLLDVCGHGVGSALMGVSALNALRQQTLKNTSFDDPISVLTALNDNYQMADHNELYFTMWYGVYNKKSRILEYGSAGHPPALLLSPDGNQTKLITENFIIGGLPDFPFKKKSIVINPGSQLYVFSDGAYEIEKTSDGTMWTIEEMFDYLAANCNNNAGEIQALLDYVKTLGGKEVLDDDFSMLRISFG